MDIKVISERVETVLVAQMGRLPGGYEVTSSLRDDLGCDSLDCIEMIMRVEEEFGVNIPDEVAEGFGTPADVIAYLSRCEVS